MDEGWGREDTKSGRYREKVCGFMLVFHPRVKGSFIHRFFKNTGSLL